jgi:cellulose synthase/poly-beta-1,6-N-acetylglucosamine synthase-like glycosyltransferase
LRPLFVWRCASLPDDQRFFFEAIMPSRDAWDGAFCCGSNSVTRRTAFEAVGNALPTGSITEDMLLTLALLRRGYVTRYLCEPFGLAPESLKAFFVQRQRCFPGLLGVTAPPLRGFSFSMPSEVRYGGPSFCRIKADADLGMTSRP